MNKNSYFEYYQVGIKLSLLSLGFFTPLVIIYTILKLF